MGNQKPGKGGDSAGRGLWGWRSESVRNEATRCVGMSSSKTALAVDDEAQLLRLVLRVLDRAGWQARTAQTEADALEVFRDHMDEIDLVLLDLNLSGRGGAEELLPMLLEMKPILDGLVMSGDALPDSLTDLLASVGGQFLRKPFVPKTLMRFLEGAGLGNAEAIRRESY